MRRDISTIVLAVIIILLILFSYFYLSRPNLSKKDIITAILKKDKNSIHVYSDDFNDQDYLATIFTCDGSDISPDIKWTNIPNETRSIALIVYDPDAPKDYFIHWIVYNLPANIYDLPRGSSTGGSLLLGKEGKNDFGELRYRGPCPPRGSVHRYIFLVIALNSFIQAGQNVPQEELLKLIGEHAIAYGYITCLYGR